MQTRSVIGKRIVRVKHRFPRNAIDYVELENGIRLYPIVIEGEADYFVDLIINKTAMKRKATTQPKPGIS